MFYKSSRNKDETEGCIYIYIYIYIEIDAQTLILVPVFSSFFVLRSHLSRVAIFYSS